MRDDLDAKNLFHELGGDGYNVVLQVLPIDGKVILRLPKAPSEQAPQQPANNRRRETRREK